MELVLLERAEGPAAALTELGRRVTAEARLEGVCHAIAHDLGHEALDIAHGKAAKALRYRDDVCGGGFTHGIVEVALGESTDPARDLLAICAPAQDGSCFHGVGHGLMFATGMDVEKAMDLCDRSPSPTLVGRCGEGVFMQLFSAEGGAHGATPGTAPMTPAAAASRCDRTRSPYSANCWFYAPTVWLADRPDDFDGVMRWCAQAANGVSAEVCARGVGSRTIKYHPEDPTIGAQVCKHAGALKDACLAGMGSYWSVHHKGKKPPSDVCHLLGSDALERRCLTVT